MSARQCGVTDRCHGNSIVFSIFTQTFPHALRKGLRESRSIVSEFAVHRVFHRSLVEKFPRPGEQTDLFDLALPRRRDLPAARSAARFFAALLLDLDRLASPRPDGAEVAPTAGLQEVAATSNLMSRHWGLNLPRTKNHLIQVNSVACSRQCMRGAFHAG